MTRSLARASKARSNSDFSEALRCLGLGFQYLLAITANGSTYGGIGQ
jgi:hypothetical protein